MKPQEKSIEVQTTKVLGPNGELIVASLDDMIRKVQKLVATKGFVKGSAFYNANIPMVEGLLSSACLCTIELLRRGPEDGGLDTDKYNLLTGKSKSFREHNGNINDILIRLAKERKEAEQAKTKQTKDAPPLSEEEQAKLVSEPTEDVDTHKSEITTNDDGRFTFDKVNYKLTLHFNDGTTRELTLAPKGTWRNTALNWICAFFKSCKEKTVKVAKSIGGFFSRLNPFKLKKDTRTPIDFDERGNPIYEEAPLPELKATDVQSAPAS